MSRGGQAGAQRRARPFRAALSHEQFRRLLASMALSTAGDWLYNVALLVFVFERTESAAWVAAATIMRLAPYVLFGAIGGAVAERNDGRRVMVVSDLARAALMGGLTVVAATDGPVALAVAFAFLTTAGGTAFLPTVAKAVPALVGEHDLAAANAVRSTVDNVAIVVGPAIGAAVLAVGSPVWAFAANALTFLLSAVVLRGLRPLPAGEEAATSGLAAAVAEGWAVLRSTASARWLVGVQMCSAAMYGLQTVFLVLVSEELLDAGTNGVGYLYAGLGFGGVAVAGITARLADAHRPSLSLCAATVLSALPIAALAVAGGLPVAVAVVGVQGAAWIVLDVVALTTMQRTLPADALGRIFGIADALLVLSMLVGSFVAPQLVDLLDLEDALIVSGAAFAAIGVAILPRLLAFDRAAAARRAELAPHVLVLERLAVFQGASRRALEALAAAAVREEVPAATDVVRQGEPATAFFVVVAGQLDVLGHVGGGEATRLNSLGAGDYFGEIGLLRRSPRLATVRSTTDCVLDRIDGEAFLDAVNAEEGVGAALEARIVGALGRTPAGHVPPEEAVAAAS